MSRRFKEPLLARCYDDVAKAARDNFSRLYLSPQITRSNRPGPNRPYRGGSTLHHAFWNGFLSDREATVRGSMAYAAWAAGKDFRKEVRK